MVGLFILAAAQDQEQSCVFPSSQLRHGWLATKLGVFCIAVFFVPRQLPAYFRAGMKKFYPLLDLRCEAYVKTSSPSLSLHPLSSFLLTSPAIELKYVPSLVPPLPPSLSIQLCSSTIVHHDSALKSIIAFFLSCQAHRFPLGSDVASLSLPSTH